MFKKALKLKLYFKNSKILILFKMALNAKYPTKSVKKISNNVIKTDKKNTRTAKQKESYGIYDYKVLV